VAIDAHLRDPNTGRSVKTVVGGALAVAPVFPSTAFNATLGTDDTAVNIVPAKAYHTFYITGLLITANQNVSNTVNATVTIYTADAENTAKGSALTTHFEISVGRNDIRDITPILVESIEGKWINGETTDDDIIVTILGYYIRTNDDV
jgi:hypothetical protein